MGNTIQFVDSSIPTKEEVRRGVEAYYSEIAFIDGGRLLEFGAEVIQSEIDNLKALGYSQDAIDFIMERQREESKVVIPHKLRYYREFNNVRDMLDFYTPELGISAAVPYDELPNGHVLVFQMPKETEEAIDGHFAQKPAEHK